jgi:hypothetical protein
MYVSLIVILANFFAIISFITSVARFEPLTSEMTRQVFCQCAVNALDSTPQPRRCQLTVLPLCHCPSKFSYSGRGSGLEPSDLEMTGQVLPRCYRYIIFDASQVEILE